MDTLRYILANPKAAGVRKGFFDPYSNFGHYSRLQAETRRWTVSHSTSDSDVKTVISAFRLFRLQNMITLLPLSRTSLRSPRSVDLNKFFTDPDNPKLPLVPLACPHPAYANRGRPTMADHSPHRTHHFSDDYYLCFHQKPFLVPRQ